MQIGKIIINGYEIHPGADLYSADLRGADLTGAKMDDGALKRARTNVTTTTPSGRRPK